ncbi:MAG: hypothetical protein A2289_07165 [Deltaproteobacteria bacterium RIFOXYA12_FULL_58_15]|nr:MAG: hypothetical protein A2289_07165 [Deltaproteobacteria bacterium RIFOXYA12_FULL_58_15]OGR10468.1 MAG: hypothetical protein A2341_22305 [Deltaproteobacteria bacterium RIFOXYB12_FULL_58_9]
MAEEGLDLVLLTSNAVARRLGVTRPTIAALVEKRQLAVAARTSSNVLLFREKEVDRLVEERRLNPPKRGRKPSSTAQQTLPLQNIRGSKKGAAKAATTAEAKTTKKTNKRRAKA